MEGVAGSRLGCGEVDEYLFESLADFEAALAGMAAPQFGAHSEALAPFVISGSQHWVIYRVQEQPA